MVEVESQRNLACPEVRAGRAQRDQAAKVLEKCAVEIRSCRSFRDHIQSKLLNRLSEVKIVPGVRYIPLIDHQNLEERNRSAQ